MSKKTDMFSKPSLDHALIVAVRNFATWLAGTQIALTASFAKCLAIAGIAALAAGLTDFTTNSTNS